MTPLQELNAALRKSGADNGIRMTTDDEILKWSATIGDASRKLTAIIDDWSFVTISDFGREYIHLVGDVVGTIKFRVTSPVLRIDLRSGFVLTLSESFYQLGTRREGEPGMDKVLAIGHTIAAWRAALGQPQMDTLQ